MINLIKKYLDRNHFSNQKEEFENFYLSHSNYPSVYALTDSLTQLGIENLAVKIPKEQLQELPESFLANYDNDLVLVTKKEDKIVIETDQNEKMHIASPEFLNKWDGIIVVIEPNETIEKIIINKNKKQGIYFMLSMLLVTLSIAYHKFDIPYIAFLATGIIGFVISVFIVQEKLGLQNETLSKLCNLSLNTSCDSVIKSNKSNINKWLSFSDLPLLFFGVNLLALLLHLASITIVGWLSLLSLPVILYSVWVQKMELKKWCVLCLAISFVITLQAFLFILMFQLNLNLSFSKLFFYLFSMMSISTIWFWMKPIIETKINIEKSNTSLIKFKRNYEVFNFLSKEITNEKDFDALNGIHFGNPTAHIKLTIIISPSCGYCHDAFKDSYELQKKYPEKVFLNVLFNLNPENNNNPYKVVVEQLLALNHFDIKKAQYALMDWHIHKTALEPWKQKWEIDLDIKSNQELYNQYNWCLTNEFNYTPVKIVNTKLLPIEYEINEIKYFINNFS
jgi:uncharacterized membrane protein/RNA polymerase subunit RPABC4/transcription elongation factor Spt4